MVFKNITT